MAVRCWNEAVFAPLQDMGGGAGSRSDDEAGNERDPLTVVSAKQGRRPYGLLTPGRQPMALHAIGGGVSQVMLWGAGGRVRNKNAGRALIYTRHHRLHPTGPRQPALNPVPSHIYTRHHGV